MRGLILKDLYNLKKHSTIYIILLIFYLIIGISNENFSMFSSMMAIIAAILPITAMAYDEKSKWDRYALTMPVSRPDIVASKYILGLIFLLLAFLISMLFNIIIFKIDFIESLLANSVSLSVGIVIISFIFPIMFKYGVEKGRLLMMLVLFAPTGIIVLLSKIGLNPEVINKEIIEKLLYLFPILAIVLLILSYLVSLSIYRKKEF